uniref:Mic1 domain-containing protein n=1 Tax=Angiostrongylus cantonensis TaxID=6313 RepID=A0A0K0D909_ANGCA
MRPSVSELRRSLEGKPYLISSFRYKNLVIFCDGSLIFVYGFVNNNGVAEYTKSVKVIPSPRIPTDVRISFMSAIHDGSLVILSSVNSLFIVRVSTDLWASKADGHVPLGQYFCGVEEVHPTLFESPRSPKLLRIRLFLHEQLQLSKSDTWTLCSSDFEFTVLVANDTTILHIDLSPWLHKYFSVLNQQSFDMGSFSISEDSVVRELISLSEYGAYSFSASCSLSQDRVLTLICKSTNPRQTTTMFIVCSPSPPLLTAFLKLQVHDPQCTSYGASEITEGTGLPLNEKVLDTILSNKKNLLPIKVASSQQELLKNLFDFFDTANKNQVVIRAALEMSRDRFLFLLQYIANFRDCFETVFRHTVAVKEKMETIRPSVLNTFARIDKISTQLTDSQELTADETKLLDVLKEYRSKMFTNAMKTSKLSLEAAQLQREIRGPARAFTASPGAKLFVLQNSEEELSALKRRLDSISAKLEEYGLRRTVENKENLQS